MDRKLAYAILEGLDHVDNHELSFGELLQLVTGACLEDSGDIWCCICHRPNECCVCGAEERELSHERT